LYLRYRAAEGLDWSDPCCLGLMRFQNWLVTQPLPPRGRTVAAEQRYRSRGAANAVMTTVCEYLKFGAAHGWVPPRAISLLSAPKFLKHPPPGYDPGEFGQFRTVNARAFRFAVAEQGYETLTPDQVAGMLRLALRARDRFLVALLACTGMRIGEALGWLFTGGPGQPADRGVEMPHGGMRPGGPLTEGLLPFLWPRTPPIRSEQGGVRRDPRAGPREASASVGDDGVHRDPGRTGLRPPLPLPRAVLVALHVRVADGLDLLQA
jgi:hypothetical protein